MNTKKKKEKKKQAAEEKKKSEGDEEKKMIEEGEIEEEEEEEIVPSVVEKTILAETKMWKSEKMWLRGGWMCDVVEGCLVVCIWLRGGWMCVVKWWLDVCGWIIERVCVVRNKYPFQTIQWSLA